ncbi:HNH endonuclease signature motif containing protein [Mycolicibacterium lacusdiani]|uniref:HNH endonuclease signature motif containing protein n=1 Tax=Mycolicibacterium lacusdiani TaxID=2895283 RepID=UPI001F239297|nr:HNH endonuclease signature motif containing protein [Mycolicibacterium lacusdiani]
MAPSLVDAAAALRAAVADLIAADTDTATVAEVVAAMDDVESVRRLLPVAEHRILNRLAADTNPLDYGATTVSKLLAFRLRISTGEASRRLAEAKDLGPRRTLIGQPLDPVLAQTAAAQIDGAINAEHVKIIRGFFATLPDHIDPHTRQAAEADLVRVAREHGPEGLRKAVTLLLALLHPDGTFSDEERHRRRGIVIGKQQADGMSPVTGYLTPEARGTFEALLAKMAAPGMCNPDDVAPVVDGDPEPERAERDTRTPAQRTHDALLAMGRMVLCSGKLGQLNGLPVTVIVSNTLQDLESAAGRPAVTAGGSLLPMPDLIRMASHAHHYLAVFDGHTGQALHLGRTRRCANPAQRIVLHARDRGCTRPGCTVDGYRSQVHHAVADWKDDGQTDVDDLSFACGPDNRMIETTAWRTRKRTDGTTEWIPPPQLDTGQARVNDLHHPERLLRQADEDDDDDPV